MMPYMSPNGNLCVPGNLEIGGTVTSNGQIYTGTGELYNSSAATTFTAAQQEVARNNIGVRTCWFKSAAMAVVATGDTDTDLGTIAIPYARWHFLRAFVYAASAVGTLGASVLLIYTAADAGGTALTAALTAANLTAANKIHNFAAASLTDSFTAATLYVRQTTDSANAGTIKVFVEVALID